MLDKYWTYHNLQVAAYAWDYQNIYQSWTFAPYEKFAHHFYHDVFVPKGASLKSFNYKELFILL